MEQVSYGPPPCMYNPTHMYTPMVSPYLIWNKYCMVPHHVCIIPLTCTLQWSPHTLYGTSIVWSPHICMVPPYLIWNRYLMVPTYLIWNRHHLVPPHVQSDGHPYLICNRYCMVPLHAHMVPPHVQQFFQTSFERVHCMA